MKTSLRQLALLIAAALAFTLAAAAPTLAEDPVIHVPDQDAEMTAAIARARASLPEFWDALEQQNPGTDGYSLKVRMADENGVEHFWTSEIKRTDGKIHATIANEPEIVKNVREGQRIEVSENDISDWMYVRNGKIVGNETMRAMFKFMSAEQADKLRSMLEKP